MKKTKTTADVIAEAVKKLKNSNCKSTRLDAEILLAFVLKKDKLWLISNNHKTISDYHKNIYYCLVDQRANGIPVAYLTNKKEFYGIEFYIDNSVLVPRDTTETLVNQAIARAVPNSHLLDLGTGSGIISVSIAKHRSDLTITATDISSKALRVASKNAIAILGLNHKIKYYKRDMFVGNKQKFSTICVNLPYVKDDKSLTQRYKELAYEPSSAIYAGPDGLTHYKAFFDQLSEHILPDGLVLLEADIWQHDLIRKLAQKVNLIPIFTENLICGFKNQLPATSHLRSSHRHYEYK